MDSSLPQQRPVRASWRALPFVAWLLWQRRHWPRRGWALVLDGQVRMPCLYRQVIPGAAGVDGDETWTPGHDGTRAHAFTMTGRAKTGPSLRLANPLVTDVLERDP